MQTSESDIALGPDADDGIASRRDTLAQEVQRVLGGVNGFGETTGLVRVNIALGDVSPLAWLAAQSGSHRFFWRGRDRNAEEVACLGAADEIRVPSLVELESEWIAHRQLLGEGGSRAQYFGGCAFDMSQPGGEEWSDYPPVWFFLPRFEVRRQASASVLSCNLVLPRDRHRVEEIRSAIQKLCWDIADAESGVSELAARSDSPSQPEWIKAVDSALDRLRAGELGKVVLARRVRFEFEEALDPLSLQARLAAVTPSCFHFLIDPGQGSVFTGASPERLFRRDGRDLWSEAVAGTRPRGASADDDARLRDELLLSRKDHLEHAFVESSIRDALDPLTEGVEIDARPSAMTLARGRHLYSRIHASLKKGVGDIQLLRALHPTPAVGGSPTKEALALIRSLEQFDRGWYAGPVGWMSDEASEFAVAIRTGLVDRTSLTLFSGAGIVEGSVPAMEWEEIEHKIGDFTSVLDLEQRPAKY